MSKLILLHGYARVGKTTLINALSNLGVPTVSTSRFADHLISEMYKVSIDFIAQKDERTFANLVQRRELPYFPCIRDFKTHVVENVIIPNLGGRYNFVKLAFQRGLTTNQLDYAIFETIGGVEAWSARENNQFKHYVDVNLIRTSVPRVYDGRELSAVGIDWIDQTLDESIEAFFNLVK